jgi:hypothetical protein
VLGRRRGARRGRRQALGPGAALDRRKKKEEGEEGRKKKGRKEKGKREKKNRKRKNRKRKGKRKEIGKGREKRFRKLGEFLGKLGGRIFWGFPLSGVSVIFGTAVMARRTSRRDRDVLGIPGAVADNGARAAGGGRRPECGWCWQDSRHARRG